MKRPITSIPRIVQAPLWLIIVLLSLLSACATVDKAPEETSDMLAEKAFRKNQYEEASKLFLQLAESSQGKQKHRWMYRAVAAMAHTPQLHQAKQILNNLPAQPSDPLLNSLQLLAQAHISLVDRQPDYVLEFLAAPLPVSTPAIYFDEFYVLRAAAHTMLGDRLATANELVKREKFLVDPDEIKANQERIWTSLATLTERDLQQLRTAPPPDILSGWMDLVRLSKVYQLSPNRLREQLLRWRQSYPTHPVSEELLSALAERKQEDVAYPDRIALILPFSGRFAKAGAALRDGFLAAYYTRRPNAQQTIKIYDAGDDPNNITAIYKRAVEEGAQFIVGPLDKESVEKISTLDELPVPTLALNYLSESSEAAVKQNLYQFGLSPEEEARQVAERTWLDGYVNSAVLVPKGSWGDRIYASFKERWELMGGNIVEKQAYDPAKTDFSQPIRSLLNIDDSQRRYRRVANTVKTKIKFTPHRRKDIDFIFVAAFPRQARQIRPQLKFYHASDVPVYATSHIFTGVTNQERDRDMDGMAFGDMPWVLAESSAHRGIRSEIERYISDNGNALQRIYALGIDAFNIIGALNTLRTYPYERYDGETGSLSLDNKQRVRRQLTWVKFRSGRPIELDRGNL